jgi:hypothetical protein
VINKAQKGGLNIGAPNGIIIIVIIAILIILLRNSHGLTREQVFRAAADIYGSENIRSVTLSQGGMAGDLGFYFVQLKSGGFIYVPNNTCFRLISDTSFRLSTADQNKHGKWTEKILPLEQKEVTLLDFFLYYNVMWMRPGLYNSVWKYPKVSWWHLFFAIVGSYNNVKFWQQY